MLGVTLDRPIIEYTSVEEFSALYDTLVNVEDFAEKNRSYGHGSISAALNAYKKYVQFLEKIISKGSEKTVYSPEWFHELAQSDELQRFDEEAQHLRYVFLTQFGVEQISALSGKELLTKLFYSDVENKDNLCYTLEFRPDMREIFGSIAGGSAFKFGLFYHKKNRCWTSGSPSKHQSLTEEEAIEVATSIRDALVKGAKLIEAHKDFDTVEGYEQLYAKLQTIPGIDNVWMLKYYQMLYPDVLPVFYAKEFQIEVLRFLKQEPSTVPFVRMGQISMFVRKCGISSPVFGQIYYDTYQTLNGGADKDVEDAKYYGHTTQSQYPDVKLCLENRAGTIYKGSSFLISNIASVRDFLNTLAEEELRLKLVLDYPQIFTAEHYDLDAFPMDIFSQSHKTLDGLQVYIQGIHIWGKRKNAKGRWIAHSGDLNSLFIDNQDNKTAFLQLLNKFYDDGIARFFVPEVNSTPGHLQNIVNDFLSVGAQFDARNI